MTTTRPGLWIAGSLWVLMLTACSWRPASQEYMAFYSHLREEPQQHGDVQERPYQLTILVDARHLDYTDNQSFFKTLTKHPDNASKEGDVGHAWILLEKEGQLVLEGGHSGEQAPDIPRYFDGVVNGALIGCIDPNHSEISYGENPVAYLWETRNDGYFERGNGGHKPTYAVKIFLTQAEYQRIVTFIAEEYAFNEYAITNHQCCTFVAQVAAIAGLHLQHAVTMSVNSSIYFQGQPITLWKDPSYSTFTFSSPDVLEKNLIYLVKEGKATYALNWYLANHYRSEKLSLFQQITRLPERLKRYQLFL